MRTKKKMKKTTTKEMIKDDTIVEGTSQREEDTIPTLEMHRGETSGERWFEEKQGR